MSDAYEAVSTVLRRAEAARVMGADRAYRLYVEEHATMERSAHEAAALQACIAELQSTVERLEGEVREAEEADLAIGYQAALREVEWATKVLDLHGAPTAVYNPYSGEHEPLNLAGRISFALNPKNEASPRPDTEGPE